MQFNILFLVIATILFAIGASRWWPTPQPTYPAWLSGGLFFFTLYTLYFLWPILSK